VEHWLTCSLRSERRPNSSRILFWNSSKMQTRLTPAVKSLEDWFMRGLYAALAIFMRIRAWKFQKLRLYSSSGSLFEDCCVYG